MQKADERILVVEAVRGTGPGIVGYTSELLLNYDEALRATKNTKDLICVYNLTTEKVVHIEHPESGLPTAVSDLINKYKIQ